MVEPSDRLPPEEQRMDALLRTAYESPDALPGDFESHVMGRITARPQNWLRSHAREEDRMP